MLASDYENMKKLIVLSLGIFLCLFLCSCSSSKLKDFVIDAELEKALEEYCIGIPDITGKPEKGKYFCAFQSYGVNEYMFKTILYAWVHSQEYYLDIDDEYVIRGGSNSMPIAFKLKKKKGIYKVVGCVVPGKGEDYMSDIRKIFPFHLQNHIRRKNVAQHNMLSKGLDEFALEKAMAFYFEE